MNEEEFLDSFCKALSKKIENKEFVDGLEDLITSRKLTSSSYKKLIKKEFPE